MLRRFRLLILLAFAVGGAFGAGALVHRPGCARAAVRVTSADPRVSVDLSLIEPGLAAFLKAQGITTQAGWTTFVNGMSAAQLLAVEQEILKREVRVDP
jgi:hypothetical protein